MPGEEAALMSQKGLLVLHSQEGPRWCPWLGLELETELELGWRGLCVPQIMILWPGERRAGSLKLGCLRGRGNERKQSEN